ncbi:MAG: YfcE family phosphodiesterase [Candidatus Latescibacteria bacterium]|nr:YfcE family phosphodiesterase [Candidatus Latescibacterota bacterium]
MTKLGVISDTHGLLRPEALDALVGSDHIVHAGDIGEDGILQELEKIAPVTAIRGNVDIDMWAQALPYSAVAEVAGHSFYLLHDREALNIDLKSAGMSAFIYGHSHQPEIEWQDGVLFLNPGSSGARRFDRPVGIAMIEIEEDGLHPRLIELDV